jgi:hypothetical protein
MHDKQPFSFQDLKHLNIFSINQLIVLDILLVRLENNEKYLLEIALNQLIVCFVLLVSLKKLALLIHNYDIVEETGEKKLDF